MHKKLFSIITAVTLLLSMPICVAEGETEIVNNEKTFFQTASPADLLALREEVSKSLYQSSEYESVSVPAGVYQVGVDIPEGKWTLSAIVRADMRIGSKLEENGKEIDVYQSDKYATSSVLQFLKGYLYKDNKYIKTVEQVVDFPNDYYVTVGSGTVVFSTYVGQPDFYFFASSLPDKTVSKRLDISSYAFHELVELRNKLNLAILNSYHWDRVIVPFGLYQIGVDIPAGNWTIESVEEYTRVSYGTKLSDYYMNLSIYDDWEKEIESPDYWNYKPEEDLASVDLDVKEGAYLAINENTCASFSPSTGKKTSLGFKQFSENGESQDDKKMQQGDFLLFTVSDSAEGEIVANKISISTNEDMGPIYYNGIKYDLLDYDDVARNPSQNKNKNIYFIGKVIQVSESAYGSSVTYRIELDGSSDVVLVHRSMSDVEPRVLEDDHVFVCGICNGVESYQSVLGGTITIPSCTAAGIFDATDYQDKIMKALAETDWTPPADSTQVINTVKYILPIETIEVQEQGSYYVCEYINQLSQSHWMLISSDNYEMINKKATILENDDPLRRISFSPALRTVCIKVPAEDIASGLSDMIGQEKIYVFCSLE